MATGCVTTMLPLANACSDASEATTVDVQQSLAGGEVQCTPRDTNAAQASGPFHSPHTPSFMTQAIKKQPRSPRDQVSPKRARMGAAGEEQAPGDEQPEEACPATVPLGAGAHSNGSSSGAAEDVPPTPIFSPAFHLTGRPSQTAADAHHGASVPVPPPPGMHLGALRWGDQQSPRYHGHQPAPAGAPPAASEADAPQPGSGGATTLPVPQLCLPPHVLAAQLRHLQQQQHEQLQQQLHMDAHPHPHHTVTPEASEHELPAPSSNTLDVEVVDVQQSRQQLDDAQMAVAAVEGSLAMVHVQQQEQQGQQPQQQQQQSEELEVMDFDPLLFIKQLPPLEQVVPKNRPPLLPGKTPLCKPKTLVLDLDETLVHSCLEAHALADFTFPVHFNSHEHIIHVRQRPHLHTFMERVAELYEVVVFTASQKIYAEKLLNIIDPQRRLIKHRIFRESCVVVEGNYLKDLSVLGRDLRTTLIVDNSPQAFGFQVDNGVPIESWYDDPADQELLKLLPFLEQLVHADDVRPAIRSRFRMRELIDGILLC